jgi:hypothetical protein
MKRCMVSSRMHTWYDMDRSNVSGHRSRPSSRTIYLFHPIDRPDSQIRKSNSSDTHPPRVIADITVVFVASILPTEIDTINVCHCSIRLLRQQYPFRVDSLIDIETAPTIATSILQ